MCSKRICGKANFYFFFFSKLKVLLVWNTWKVELSLWVFQIYDCLRNLMPTILQIKLQNLTVNSSWKARILLNFKKIKFVTRKTSMSKNTIEGNPRGVDHKKCLSNWPWWRSGISPRRGMKPGDYFCRDSIVTLSSLRVCMPVNVYV